jgi:hypothetical protein
MTIDRLKLRSVIELYDKLIAACDGYDLDVVDFALTDLLADVTVGFASGDIEEEKRRVLKNIERFIDCAVERGDESLN